MDTFGQRLRAARSNAKINQATASKKAGMSQSTLSELENDEYPTSTFTTRLAHIYGVSARWLADGEGAMSATEMGSSDAPRLEEPNPPWPFSDRITPEAYSTLDATIKEDIEDYIELKLTKLARIAKKSAAARKARAA